MSDLIGATATATLSANVRAVSADSDGALLTLMFVGTKEPLRLKLDAKDGAEWMKLAGRNVGVSVTARLAQGTQEELKPAAVKKRERKLKKHDGPHRFVLKHCIDCGEPEPLTCERGFHFVEGDVCSRCGMAAPERGAQSKLLAEEEAANVKAAGDAARGGK